MHREWRLSPSPVAGSWKDRLYGAYVSSGQASPRRPRGVGETADALFEPYAPHVNSLIAAHLPADRRTSIVDLGCGDGMFVYFLTKAGYSDVIGIDFSPEQVARAHRLGVTHVRQGRIEGFLERRARESVDVVLLMDVLEHMTMDALLEVLDGVVRVLRPGGICLAHVPNAEGINGMRIRYGDLTHELAFTATSCRQVFRTAGFSEVRCFEDRPVVHGPASFIRRVIWDVGTLPRRLLLAAETGEWHFVLSQTLLVKASKAREAAPQERAS